MELLRVVRRAPACVTVNILGAASAEQRARVSRETAAGLERLAFVRCGQCITAAGAGRGPASALNLSGADRRRPLRPKRTLQADDEQKS